MIPVWRWRVFVANLDPVIGSEQAGTRPVIVLSDEAYNQVMPLVTALPVTSRKPGRRVYANEVLLARGSAGLPEESIVLTHQIRTISKRRLIRPMGDLDDLGKQEQIQEALSKHLGFWESR